MDVTVVVLCGGRSSRFGSDKTRAPFRGSTVLDHLLADLPPDWPVVAVGEQRRTVRDAAWTRESPLFAGPLAAVEAALPLIGTASFALVAGDMPYAGRAVSELVATLDRNPTVEAVAAADPAGRRQPLLAAYRTDAVRVALPSPTANAPMRRLLDALVVTELALPAAVTADVDEPADLAALDEER
ncbi:molybdenum cofactor guanylyltransferase [Luteipulveratus flavus]|uniref:NTP transferase domain-containing protein n=1 Tax=Luteipulveratus flavus TaxID=3031728 RepID=A0ABT6CBY8_9MICO|nr:NTP transferase domain-containing protein [Luteipulveratus sp. YIM 133296]MDF8266419.1 NTP transferase domain-containing protein [Luteipulveratus sp. YIM 133296]